MALRSGPWDPPIATPPFGDNRQPNAAWFRRAYGGLAGNINERAIILAGSRANGDRPFGITITNGNPAILTVGIGVAVLNGLLVVEDSGANLNIPVNSSSYPRKDALFLRIDIAENEMEWVYAAGAPHISDPQAPQPTNSATTKDFVIAEITTPGAGNPYDASAIEYIAGFTMPAPATIAPFQNIGSGRIPYGYPVKRSDPPRGARAIALCNKGDPLLGIAAQEIGPNEWGGVATNGIVQAAVSGAISINQLLTINTDNRFTWVQDEEETYVRALEVNNNIDSYIYVDIEPGGAAGAIQGGPVNFAQYFSADATRYTTNSTTYVPVDSTNLNLTLTTSGRPVEISLAFSAETKTAQNPKLSVDVQIDGSSSVAALLRTGNTRLAFLEIDPDNPNDLESHLSMTLIVPTLPAGQHTFRPVYRVNTNPNTETVGLANVYFHVREL